MACLVPAHLFLLFLPGLLLLYVRLLYAHYFRVHSGEQSI